MFLNLLVLIIVKNEYSSKQKKAVLGIITKHRLWRCEEYIPTYLRPLRIGGGKIKLHFGCKDTTKK